MARSRAKKLSPSPDATGDLAFLLSQVGAHAASKFWERIEPLGLKPPHAGILRVIRESDGLSQQALGEKLGIFPSRLVVVLDELETYGLVERRDNPTDRRSYALYLTSAGHRALEQIARIAREHEAAVCAALNDPERAQLAALLGRIADEQGLTPGVHPGFRRL
jgi:DNA-binding MarR family transcriptional regulator